MAGTVGIPLPPPYQGQNDRLPTVALQNPFCVNMENFHNKGGNAVLRQGLLRYASGSSPTQFKLLTAVNYSASTELLLVMMDLGGGTGGYNWYSVTANLYTLVRTEAALSGNNWIETLYFNGYLFFMGDNNLSSAAGLEYYNGSAWGVSTYTWPASFKPRGGCVFKNRAYWVGDDSAAYGFTEIDAISGTITKKDLAGVVNSKSSLYMIRSVSSTENVTLDNVLCFIFSNGDVLVYSGAYPDSAISPWTLAARLKISAPVGYNSFIDAKGDSFILTNSEVLSLRNTIANGYSQEKLTGIGASIQKRYAQIMGAFLADKAIGSDYTQWIKGVYDEQRDRLIISFPYYIDKTGTGYKQKAFQLIYDFSLNGWYEYIYNIGTVSSGYPAYPVVGIVYHKNDVYFVKSDFAAATYYSATFKVEGNTDYMDEATTSLTDVGIDYKLTSAPHPLSKFGTMVAGGLEMTMKSDIYSTMNVKLIGDLGAQETSTQVTSGNGTNVSKVLIDEGIESNIIQYEITGTSTTSTVGLEIYATNLWLTTGTGVGR